MRPKCSTSFPPLLVPHLATIAHGLSLIVDACTKPNSSQSVCTCLLAHEVLGKITTVPLHSAAARFHSKSFNFPMFTPPLLSFLFHFDLCSLSIQKSLNRSPLPKGFVITGLPVCKRQRIREGVRGMYLVVVVVLAATTALCLGQQWRGDGLVSDGKMRSMSEGGRGGGGKRRYMVEGTANTPALITSFDFGVGGRAKAVLSCVCLSGVCVCVCCLSLTPNGFCFSLLFFFFSFFLRKGLFNQIPWFWDFVIRSAILGSGGCKHVSTMEWETSFARPWC